MTTTTIDEKNPFLEFLRAKERADKRAANIARDLQRENPNSVIVVVVPVDACPCAGRLPTCRCQCD